MIESLPIGESFEYKGKTYKVVASTTSSCEDCDFFENAECFNPDLKWSCILKYETTYAIFKEVENG